MKEKMIEVKTLTNVAETPSLTYGVCEACGKRVGKSLFVVLTCVNRVGKSMFVFI